MMPAIAENDRASLAPVQEIRGRDVLAIRGLEACRCQIVTIAIRLRYGSGWRNSVSRSATIETVPPMPSARMKTAARVKDGDFASIRTPCRRSCTRSASAVN